VNDNDELAMRASTLLVRMCGVTPPTTVVKPILTAIFDAILKSPVSQTLVYRSTNSYYDLQSWRLRLKAMPLVQVFYFRQMPSFTETKVTEVIEILCQCLDDEIVEVREMAAT
jgi:proteasome activator subunit 4